MKLISHVPIILIFSSANFREKEIPLYMAYTKMTKYPYENIIIGFLLFKEIKNYLSFFFVYYTYGPILLENLHK
jgi:hypothetical protein